MGINVEPGTFTIPKEPVRRRLNGIETFNVLRGGEYSQLNTVEFYFRLPKVQHLIRLPLFDPKSGYSLGTAERGKLAFYSP
jgi:hypothetical protein